MCLCGGRGGALTARFLLTRRSAEQDVQRPDSLCRSHNRQRWCVGLERIRNLVNTRCIRAQDRRGPCKIDDFLARERREIERFHRVSKARVAAHYLGLRLHRNGTRRQHRQLPQHAHLLLRSVHRRQQVQHAIGAARPLQLPTEAQLAGARAAARLAAAARSELVSSAGAAAAFGEETSARSSVASALCAPPSARAVRPLLGLHTRDAAAA
eukprot:1830825-Pleurochrysis_carterae.AAC.1